ncbi:MAG: tetratricopeptide repeat protein [Planctomycetes bacterium]|nr:tetratricopeptide repeat protein [Planctomycetota bacterium]
MSRAPLPCPLLSGPLLSGLLLSGLLLSGLLGGCSVTGDRGATLDAGSWRSSKARMYHDLALQCLRGGDHERARSLLQQAVQFDGNEPRTLELLTRLAYGDGELATARNAAQMLLQLDPTSVTAQCTLAAVAEDEGRTDVAEAGYRRALELTRDDPRPAIGLHRLLLNQGREADAELLRGSIAERFPRNAEVWLDRGAQLAAGQRWSDAAVAYGSALAVEPDNVDAATSCALSAVLSGRPGEAATIGDQLAPRARTGHVDLALILATARLRAGEPEAALRELEPVERQLGGRSAVRILRGEILLHLHRLDAAREEFEAALATEPGAARAHAGLGRVYLQQGRHQEAARALQLAVQREPGNGVTRALLAAGLASIGDSTGAAFQLARARELPDAARLVPEVERLFPALRERAEVRR